MDEFTASHVIPDGVENPTPILFWEPLEFTISLMFLGFGILSHMWVLGAAVAGIVLIGAPRLKRGYRRGAMPHILWSKGLQMDPNLSKWFKPAWINDFTE